MGSSGKKWATMAKLNRESRDRRVEKQARRAAGKLTAGGEPAEAASRAEAFGANLPHPAADVSDGADPKPGAAASYASGGA